MSNHTDKKYDAFISHASEDKNDFVKPLADVLVSVGANIWYDEFSLQIGKSLSRSIDKGLSNSKFGIIVLSKNFFAKDWPEYELKGLNALELGNEGIILPIWHKITRSDILNYSPFLADKLAVDSAKYSIEAIAVKLLEIIRPDLSENYHKRKAWESIRPKGDEPIHMVKPEVIKASLYQHKSLPSNLLNRIRLIRVSLLSGYPHTFKFWVDGFMRDLHPEDEIEAWEKIAFCYLEAIQCVDISYEQFPDIFKIVFSTLFLGELQEGDKKSSNLPKKVIEEIKKICCVDSPYLEVVVKEQKFKKGLVEIDIYKT